MNQHLATLNKILKYLFIVAAIIFSAPYLWLLISGLTSYFLKIDVWGADYHTYLSFDGDKLSSFQLSWIISQTTFLLLIFISVFFMDKKWWFYYIWSILIAEYIFTNTQRSDLFDKYFWVPMIYTVIFYLIDIKNKKAPLQNKK